MINSLLENPADMANYSGIDIVSISRIQSSASKEGFLKRVFTEGEINYSFGRRSPYKHLAGRFAAKEACLKALTTGLSKGIGWKDIEVVNTVGGQPVLRLYNEAQRSLGDRKPFLSIAYSEDLAVAFVVIE